MKFVFLLLTTALAAFAAAPTPTTLKAAVVIGAKDEVKLGTLTVGDKQLDFEGADLLFSVPLDAVEDVQVAGFREKWMSVGIRATSDFGKSYSFLLQPDGNSRNAPARVQFLLPPNSDLKSALTLAQDFKARADAALAVRHADEQAAKAQAEREKQERQQPAQLAAKLSAPPTVAPARREQAPPQAKLMLAVRAYYLEKKPGGFMKNFGLSGELMFREDGIGFAFHEAPKLDNDRQRAADGGTIFVPFEGLGTGFVRDQKLLLGAAPTMFFVVLTPRPGTQSYERLRPFLTQDGELLFTVRAMNERVRINSLLTRLNASNF